MLSEASLTEFAGEILLTWVPPSTATSTRIYPSKPRPEATTPGVIGVFSGALAYRGSGPFTTGGGIALDQGKNFLDGTDTDSLVLWVDNYCAANSLKNVAEAGAVLSAELARQKGL